MVNNTSITKAECNIIAFFLSNIQKEFGIREISRNTKTDYKNTYSIVQKLVKKGVLLKRRQANLDLCSLNLKGDFGEICFVEAMRARIFRAKHRMINEFFNAAMEKARYMHYSIVVFGSFAKGKETKSSDLDILVIAPEKSAAEEIVRILNAESVTIAAGIHAMAISTSDFISNLADKKPNVITEAFKSHIIITGAESFYKGGKFAL
ncbi:MAG: nucleotidyltransferase domain-containing protein [Candidatus Nanoarchaeia archaeon]|nr:nucleotidyltransferase domain-containing protein [Candidatus Nanoarchaeia archaeon]